MNRIILTFCLFAFTLLYTQAASIVSHKNFSAIVFKALPPDQEIAFEQLPEDVKIAYEESVFAHWEVKKIERFNLDTNNIIYKVTVSNGTEEFDIIIDQDGNVIG